LAAFFILFCPLIVLFRPLIAPFGFFFGLF